MKLLILACFVFSTTCCANISHKIIKNYQDKLYTLPINKQEHFSIRMYILTGDSSYVTPIVSYVHFLSLRYQAALSALGNPVLIANEERKLLEIDDVYTIKRKRYNQHIAQFKGMGFYINLLVIINKVASYHLEDTPLFPNIQLAIKAIKMQRNAFKQFILDEKNIKIYGAQLINYVFYLKDLGILDVKSDYTKAFKSVFSDENDSKLSRVDYEAKIYGMTHFITAASHYYKNPVNYSDYAWIVDYFETNIDEIIRRTENDVIAEVGVCLMLVHRPNEGAIKKIKSHLIKEYDPDHVLVKNKINNVDFIYGEHRNILTIMIFKWSQDVMDDPLLYDRLNEHLLLGINSTLKISL